MKDKSIGFFGGSFDPIHFGHIHLALSIYEECQLDQIIFCPTYISPFKNESKSHVSGDHRITMIKKAIQPLPFFTLCDFEVKSGTTSFTIDTIKHLRQEYESQKLSVNLFLILGDDMLQGLPKWKSVEELLSLARPLVGCRNGDFSLPDGLSTSSVEKLKEGLIQMPVMNISSTMVRHRFKKGEFCGHLVPHNTLEYIHENNLY